MKEEEKDKGGRPPHYTTAEEMQVKIDEYFTYQDELKRPLTITGLALHLGFCDRSSFYDYEENEGFFYTIKKARTRIENNYEEHLFSKAYPGAIFALKNFGWKDKQEIEHSGNESKPITIKKTYEK